MKIINIGVIGGGVGLRCIAPKFNEIKGTSIIAFMSSNFEKTEEKVKEYNILHACKNIQEMCQLPLDLICIASPTQFHLEQVEYILKKKINVLCEKPLGSTFKETIKILNIFRATKSITLVDLELRFNPFFIEIKNILNEMGEIYHIDMFFHSDLYLDSMVRNSWNYSANVGGGVRMSIMPHFLDLLYFWINRKCISLRAYMNAVTNNKNISDFCFATLEFESSITASLSASAVVQGDKNIEIKILTTKGIIEFDLKNGIRVNQKKIDIIFPDYYDMNESIFRSSFACYAREIVGKLRKEKKEYNFTSHGEMKQIHVLLNDIKNSANMGYSINYRKNENNYS